MGKQLKKQDQKNNLLGLQDRLSYQFRDLALLEQALTHKSAQSSNNERLEFLGDSILNSSITIYLYQNYPDQNEGRLSRIRSNLVKGETLTQIANDIKLGENLSLGAGELKSGGHKRASILADAVEAVIGAVFLEAGFERARDLVLELYKERLEPDHIATLGKDAKTRLQEFLQGRGLSLPEYVLETVSGKEHKQVFQVSCHIPELGIKEQAEAGNRRNAEKKVASLILEKIETSEDE